MNERGNVIIIPDENQILTREYKKRDISKPFRSFHRFCR